MSAFHCDFFFTATGHPAEQAGAPNASNPPHPNTPATIQAPDALSLLAFLKVLRRRSAEKLVCARSLGRVDTDALLVDYVPHSSNNATVGTRGGDDSLNV